jgi:U2 small nuclear ribonucleoprotein A'
LGVTEDNFDTIDFSDNEIVVFENFPLLKNLRTIFFNNNNITKIKKGYSSTLPAIDTLIFTNNSISELGDF